MRGKTCLTVNKNVVHSRLSMPLLLIISRLITFFLVLVIYSPSALASTGFGKVYDTRILVDASDNLEKNDPSKLRIEALRMLVSVLPKGSYAGVWEFGDLVNINMPYGKVSQHWLQEADHKVKALELQTRFSNLDQALRKVTEGWGHNEPNKERNIIILTGNKLKVSTKEGKNLANKSRIIDELIPFLQARDIRVYIAAFGPLDIDRTEGNNEGEVSAQEDGILTRLSDATDGRVYLIENKESLQQAFLSIFTEVAAADELPIFKNAFYVDRSVEEATILLLRQDNIKTAKPVMLKSPVGVTYSYQRHPKWIRWVKRDLFSLITLSKPLYGQWHILADYLSPLSKVLIMTQLQLEVNELPKIAFAGERFRLKAKILNQGKLLNDPNVIKVIKLVGNIRGKEESIRNIISASRPEQAKYVMDVTAMTEAGHDPSTMEIRLFADGITFEREFVQKVQVFNSPITWMHKVISNNQQPVYAVTITARHDLVESDDLKLRVFVKSTSSSSSPSTQLQHKEITLEKQANGSWMFWLPALPVGQSYQIRAQLSGVTIAQRPFGILESVYSVEGTVVPSAAGSSPSSVSTMSSSPMEDTRAEENESAEESGGAVEEQVVEEESPSEDELLGEDSDENHKKSAEEADDETSESDFIEEINEHTEGTVKKSGESNTDSSLITILFFIVLASAFVVAAVFIPLIIIMRKRQRKMLQSMAEAEGTIDNTKDNNTGDDNKNKNGDEEKGEA
ncbi:hypothetical protein Psal006b_02004 [Piscirickettsia salmonis]|uniref:von Willebrand factor type A domain protein n=1 Tax=Piscirickettsia salmonis TaxID=1238 RepID=A0AAC8VH22_PISSA|nr:VWA domain-containing protein [Piscirickettsia salmonis]ALB22390.1 von Willebrand factor type A domain protein [Piscirickettsia salmonis]QGN99002.1 hypothetical protein Psal006b_02004 [Piscirickettsia salmonis]QGO02633.1 hypothetical protein Psal008_02024 [Piscirickettsia salmonis]QGO13299.1 hypothetical protein Psal010b_02001 [Piscirickettsia salmonis]QGO20369.1 hypothetical protein Psal013_02031 [Piscirickettsia salmonis]